MRSNIAFASMLLLFAACSSKPVMTASDMAASADASVPVDMGVPQDLAGADLAGGCMPKHSRCAWFYKNQDGALDSLNAGINSDYFNAIHPVWYRMLQPCANNQGQLEGDCGMLDGGLQGGGCARQDGGGCTGCRPGIDICEIAGAHDPAVMTLALNHNVDVIPMVAATGKDAPQELVALNDMLGSHESEHAAALTKEATARHYKGFDLDYERIGGLANASKLVAFLQLFALTMHQAQPRLQASVDPPFEDPPNYGPGVWDYAALANGTPNVDNALDTIHIQGYDFHSGSQWEPGPNAPLGLIQRIVDYTTLRVGVNSSNVCKFILGLPNYGYDWSEVPDAGGVTAVNCDGLTKCADRCRPNTIQTSDHMDAGHCDYWKNGEYAPDGNEKRCQSVANGAVDRRLYFDDKDSLCEKVNAAAAAQPRMGGISYWTMGFEPAGFWNCVKSKF